MKVFVASIIILILGLSGLLNPLRNGLQAIMTPVQFGLRRTAIDIKDTSKLFYNLNDLRNENSELLAQNQELRSLILDLKKLSDENETLRSQLNLQQTDQYFGKKLLSASVMGNPNDQTNTTLLLNRGASQGVKVGTNVVYGSFLIGRVSSVTNNLSTVELITAPNFSATVKDLETKTEGVAKGNLGTTVSVTKILAGEKVEVGDSFVTTGRDGFYLPGFSVGTVVSVSQESAQPVKTALLNPKIFEHSLNEVFLLIDQ